MAPNPRDRRRVGGSLVSFRLQRQETEFHGASAMMYLCPTQPSQSGKGLVAAGDRAASRFLGVTYHSRTASLCFGDRKTVEIEYVGKLMRQGDQLCLPERLS
jgi:hypothetical protein